MANTIFFGIGGGFVGTHSLAKILDLCPKVYCRHEIRTKHSMYALFDKWKDAHDDVSLQFNVIKRERTKLAATIMSTGDAFGEINSILRYFVLGIHKSWKRAKFIFVVRDPKTHILSIHNRDIFNKGTARGRFIPENTKYEDLLLKSAWLWDHMNRECMDNLACIPKKLSFTYYFEDLIVGKRLEELCKFLDIKAPNRNLVRGVLKEKYGEGLPEAEELITDWKDVDPARVNQVKKIVAETAGKLGYSLDW